MPEPTLAVRVGGRTWRFPPDAVVTVGRDPGATVVLDHPLVSRLHLTVRREEGRWVVRDAGSANGTFTDQGRVSSVVVDGRATVRAGHPVEGPALEFTTDTGVEPVAAPPDPQASVILGGHVVRIGRAPDNDLVLDDLLVSRYHAELRPTTHGHRLVDLGSHNGTFLNGRRITEAEVSPGDTVAIGLDVFDVTPAGLEARVHAPSVEFAALGLHVEVPGGPVLLDDVSFALAPGSLLAVVGPSGSGKSTLLGALTGTRPATSGRVRYGGRDLYASLDELSGRMGIVPQDDILHPQLTVRTALEYGAELRFPPDTGAAERRRRVDEVLDELGLSHRADVVIERLSGGQRKRVSVALELLTRPSLLFLDEPTSGLDPGTERSLMEQLRALADGGRTVVVVTHSPQSLHLCDRVLYLAPGGQVGWFGPPGGAPAFFGCADEQEVFRALADDPRGWPDRFRAHPDHHRYVDSALTGEEARDPTAAGVTARNRRRVGGWWRQWSTLSRRYTRVLVADRRNLALLVFQAPFLGVLLLAALPPGELAPLPVGQFRLVSRAPFVLFLIMLSVTWLGASNAVREIAKEIPILRRERAAGLSTSAYLASKVAVLGSITTVQAVVVASLALVRQHGPPDALVVGWAQAEIVIAAVATGLAAMCMGLAVSALAKSPDRAMTTLPLVLVLQILLAVGAIFPEVTDKPVLHQASFASSTQWGVAAAGSTAELNRLAVVNDLAKELPSIDLGNPIPILTAVADAKLGNPRFDHDAATWWSAMAAIALLGLLMLIVTWTSVVRLE